MTNRYRGEVSLTLGDRSYPLRLSLQALAEIEAAALEAALARYDGSMSEAARRLGIGRTTLYRKTRGEEEPA